jgi:hypothetical protein
MSIGFDGIRHFLLQSIESFGIACLFGLSDRQILPSRRVWPCEFSERRGAIRGMRLFFEFLFAAASRDNLTHLILC